MISHRVLRAHSTMSAKIEFLINYQLNETSCKRIKELHQHHRLFRSDRRPPSSQKRLLLWPAMVTSIHAAELFSMSSQQIEVNRPKQISFFCYEFIRQKKNPNKSYCFTQLQPMHVLNCTPISIFLSMSTLLNRKMQLLGSKCGTCSGQCSQ